VSRDKDPIALSDEHNSRGIELADRGWLDEAIKEFKKAIELDPQSAHAHDNLATVFSEKKQYREALHEYLAALALEPDSATAHYNLASFLATHGPDMAVSEYKEAIQLDPDYPDAHLNLGLTYADQGSVEEALKELEAAIALDPRDPFPRHELAALLMDEGDYHGAITQLKEVARLDPDGFDGHLDLGICYAQKGFYAEAERAYARAKELNPEDLLLNYNLAALYALWGKPEPSLDALRRALASDPTKVRGWLATDPMFDAMKGAPTSSSSRAASRSRVPSPAPLVLQPPLRDALHDRALREAELAHHRGALAAVSPQGQPDRLALDLLQREAAQVERVVVGRGGGPARVVEGHPPTRDLEPLAAEQGARCTAFLSLADVPGPVVGLEPGERLRGEAKREPRGARARKMVRQGPTSPRRARSGEAT
jgi:tetratricopeptide (TPR) repeat protein